MGILIKVAITAVALWVATLVPGISLSGGSTLTKIGTLVAVAVIFGVVNAILKPIIKTVGCAFYIFTLGLIALVINGALFLLVGWIAEQLDLPFQVDSFWPAAVLGAVVVAIVSFVLNLVVPDGKDDD
ncbi:MAG: phage holin family protein [Micromonosporaceae bacterium]|nr:phage holin family protein [Micromonosporaceae bacterium]